METTVSTAFQPGDYSLVGKDSKRAVEKGLANARWYTSPVPRGEMRKLLERRDGPALRDTAIWFGLIIFFALCGYWLWGTLWAVIPFALYGVMYGSTSDSRWHETSHGTAFKTDWMNNVLYEIASFMVLRESTVWRWSHARHHSDTIIVGLDPEIVVQRPVDLLKIFLGFFGIFGVKMFFTGIFRHCLGRFTAEESTFIPDSARKGIVVRAWIYILIFCGVIGLSISTRSILPLMYIGFPTFYGAWLMVIYGLTQHAGLSENVLDHRLNSRTVYMNWINRYLYWNMNYHVEHHMFPLVPYHALPRLHEIVKADMPPAYSSIAAAYREIIPTLLRQAKDLTYFIRRPIPPPAVRDEWVQSAPVFTAVSGAAENGWIVACSAEVFNNEDVIRFDHQGLTYAIYQSTDGTFHATEGACTHGNAHLADGLVFGNIIECGKHNGRFDIRDGSAKRLPACVPLKTYPVREERGRILLNIFSSNDQTTNLSTYTFRVVSNRNASAFIKELVLEPLADSPKFTYHPGDYLQFDIPAYPVRSLRDVEIDEKYHSLWDRQRAFDVTAVNPVACRRNYSLASNPEIDHYLRFNVRLSLPPRGVTCSAGVGSTYLFGLKSGDIVSASGPYGEFHIRSGMREMVYLGGGAGMAPLRSHLSYLLETWQSERQISYWYGARSRQELLYLDYFQELVDKHPSFEFHPALSEPLDVDHWDGHIGFIHEILKHEYLKHHPDPKAVDYYLCGPPAMMRAAVTMLNELGVPVEQIIFDEF